MKLNKDTKSVIKEFGHLFVNTGNNDIVELIEREGVDIINNVVVVLLQVACESQALLLCALKEEGLLKGGRK